MPSKTIPLLIFSVVLSSCLTKKEIVYCAAEYRAERSKPHVQTTSHIRVQLDMDSLYEGLVKVKTNHRKILPFILVNYWNTEQDISLPHHWFADVFEEAVLEFNDSINLHSAFDGKELYVNLNEVPNEYQFKNEGWFIAFIFLPIGVGSIDMITPDFGLKARVELVESGRLVEAFDYAYNDVLYNYHYNFFDGLKSKKKFSKEYLEWRDKQVKWLAYTMCEQLLERPWED